MNSVHNYFIIERLFSQLLYQNINIPLYYVHAQYQNIQKYFCVSPVANKSSVKHEGADYHW